MLVTISDLHLTDGTCSPTLDAGAFEVFGQRLADMAERASWRADGAYRPVDKIELLLLGDVLDAIRSNRWLTSKIRPWGNVQSPEMIEMVSSITADILRHNEAGLAVLRSLAVDGAIGLPPANHNARPAYNAAPQPVHVRIHYMVGNHDWFYHLPGTAYDVLRQTVTHHLGLANRHDVPFAHDPAENEELLAMMRRHKVLARHGDIFDPLNFDGDRDGSSLGDAIVIQLINRFTLEIENKLAGALPAETLAGLREIDNIRPVILAPVWIDGLLDRTSVHPSVRKQIKQIWDQLADEFLSLEFVKTRDTWSRTDLVDGLARALKFSKRLTSGWASNISAWLQGLRGAAEDSYFRHALGEPDFRNRRARHIVYGHTHQTESVPLDASYADGFVLNQMYFNAGTWKRVHRPTRLAPGEHEFIAAESLNLLSFYQGDERGGRPFESWSGMLGLSSQPLASRLTSTAVHSHASRQSISAPELPLRAPHFATHAAVPHGTAGRRIG